MFAQSLTAHPIRVVPFQINSREKSNVSYTAPPVLMYPTASVGLKNGWMMRGIWLTSKMRESWIRRIVALVFIGPVCPIVYNLRKVTFTGRDVLFILAIQQLSGSSQCIFLQHVNITFVIKKKYLPRHTDHVNVRRRRYWQHPVHTEPDGHPISRRLCNTWPGYCYEALPSCLWRQRNQIKGGVSQRYY